MMPRNVHECLLTFGGADLLLPSLTIPAGIGE
jgi:hypothetical protein